MTSTRSLVPGAARRFGGAARPLLISAWSLGRVVALMFLGAAQASASAAPGAAEEERSELRLPFERYTLPNGLEVILSVDRSLPLVHVNVWYHVGSGDETPGKSGFAHLFEHMMFQGTANTGEDRHFPILQEAGATDANGSTNTNRTNYYQTVPAHQLETALWLESERMGYLLPSITEQSLANQRDVVRNERRQNYDNVAYGKDRFAVNAALYPENHPYRHLTIGRHEDVEGGTLEDVKNFFRTWYVPANATLTLVGDIDPAQAKTAIAKWFGGFPRSEKPRRWAIAAPAIDHARRVTLHDHLAKLRRVHYAWHSPAFFAPGDADLDLLASVLGAEGTGRLYRILVLEKRLAQNVAVYQASAQLSSTFHVVVDALETADLAEIERILGVELDRARREPVSPNELHRAIVNYETQYVWGLEGLTERAEALQMYNHSLGEPGKLTWDLDRYRLATAAGIQDNAAKYLVDARRVEAITLPVAAPQEDPAVDLVAAMAPTKALAGPQSLAFPGDAFRATQPSAGTPHGLEPPRVARFVLSNGLAVYLVERHELPIVSLELSFAGGPVADPRGKEGLAALCLDLLDDGTEALDKLAFGEALADIGSQLNARAAIDRQIVSTRTLRKHVDRTLDLLADTLIRPGLREADFARNLDRALARLKQAKAAPGPLSSRLVATVFYGENHPVGKLVTEASAKAVTGADCRGYASDWLRPQGTRLFVVGDITEGELRTRLEARLAAWEGSPRPAPALPVPVARAGRIFFADIPGAAQSAVSVGHPGPSRQAADYVATNLLVGILGGDFGSRINMNLREGKGWAYGAGAFHRYYPEWSVFRATASVRTDATSGSVEELVTEVRRIQESGVTAEELTRQKNGEILALPGRFAGNDAILGTLMELDYLRLPLDTYGGYAAKVAAATKAEVDAAAKQHLRPEALQVLAVGDGKVVRAGLEELLTKDGLLTPGAFVVLDADGKRVGGAGANP